MGVEEQDWVEEDLKEPYFSLGETRMTTGIMPSRNTPGTTGITFGIRDAKGLVTAPVADDGTTVTFTLPDMGGIETAVLLLPYDGAALYTPVDCLPQYVEHDEIHVFQVEDGTWYAPGPFIPKEDIKAIFECP